MVTKMKYDTTVGDKRLTTFANYEARHTVASIVTKESPRMNYVPAWGGFFWMADGKLFVAQDPSFVGSEKDPCDEETPLFES